MESNIHSNLKKLIIGLVVVGIIALLVARSQYGQSTSSVGLNYGGGEEMAMMDSNMAVSVESFGLAERKAFPSPSIGIVPPQPPGFETGGGDEFVPEDRLIIKTANLSIVVENVETAINAVVGFATGNGGFEVNRNIYKQGLGFAGTVTVRVPVTVFENSLESTKKLGDVRSQQSNGRDVTEEFVDVQAQIKNLKTAEQQFQNIMLRATKIEDVLAVQRELSNVRSQIERMEGRKKYLEQSSSLSTLTVNFSTDPDELPVVDDQDKWKPLSVVKEAVRQLLKVAQSLVDALIWVVIFIPVWIVLIIVYRAAKKKMHNSNQQ